MNKKNLVISVVLAVALIAGVSVYALRNNNDRMAAGRTMGQNNAAQPGANVTVDKNSAEYKMYSGLKGEDYDRMFIANMIAHHQGAVDMAKLALTNAKHQELKAMANAVVAAQTKEISDMQSWQQQWGYPATSGAMMDHSAMGTMDEMTGMTEKLKGLTGDAFDKAFMSSMITHHQSAINMAYPGRANAMHAEVKALTKAVVDAQSKEIAQMKQWQKLWGYSS